MKKFLRSGLIAALCLTMLLSLTACNKFGSVKKAFEKAGWTYSEETNSEVTKLQESFKDEEGNGPTVTPHIFTKDTLKLVVVFEFKSSKELEKELEDNETLKGMLKDSQKSDYVNGNCVLIPITVVGTERNNVIDIFKNA